MKRYARVARRRGMAWLLAAAVVVWTGPVQAGLIDVDFNDDRSNTYSGAAAMGFAGDTWNGIQINGISGGTVPLVDSAGVSTNVTLNMLNDFGNDAWGSGPHALLGDYLNTQGDWGFRTVRLSNLAPGTYDIFCYGGASLYGYANGTMYSWLDGSQGCAATTFIPDATYLILHAKVEGDGFLDISASGPPGAGTPGFFAGVQVMNSKGATWVGGSSGDVWSETANWSAPVDPDGAGAGAIFGTAASSGHGTVTLDGNRTVCWLDFYNSESTTLTTGSGKTLTIDNLVPDNGDIIAPLIRLQASGSHAINTPVNLAGSVQVLVPDNGSQMTIGGTISGPGGITKQGGGTLLLSGTNTYTGVTYIAGYDAQPHVSILRAGSTTAFGAPDSAAVEFLPRTGQRRAVLDLGGFNVTISRLTSPGGNDGYPGDSGGWQWGHNIANISGTPATLTVSNSVDCSYLATLRDNGGVLGLTKDGTGRLTINGSYINYSGQCTVRNGTLDPGGLNNANTDGALGNSALAVILGGTGTMGTLVAASGSCDKPFTLAAGGAGAFQVDSGTLTLSGQITGGGGLVKTGGGTLILSASGNSYGGDTSVSAGTLKISEMALCPTADVCVVSGAVFDLDFTGTNSIRSLYVDDVRQVSGVWGPSGSGAPHESACLASTSGGGRLQSTFIPTCTWTGSGTDNYWGNGANWTVAPSNRADLFFAVSARTTPYNNFALDTPFSGITFNSGASSFILNGNAIILDGPILNNSSSDQTINMALVLPMSVPRAFKVDTGSMNMTLSGSLSGLGGLVKVGGGQLTLSAANSHTGGNTLGVAGGGNAGTLRLSGAGTLGSSASPTAMTIYGGTLDLNGTIQSVSALNLGGGAAGSTALVSIGAGELKLGGAVTYTAAGDPNGATISGAGGGKVSLNGNRTFTVGDSSAAASDLIVSAIIQNGTGGSWGVTKAGDGTLTLSGANTYSGVTTISAGILTLANTSALGGSTLDYSGGTLSFGSLTNATLGGLQGTQSLALTNSAGAAVGLTVGGNNQSSTYSGVLSGNSSLTKAGMGKLTLTASNTYTGNTRINAGILSIAGAWLSTNSSVYVGSGATFDLAFVGTNTINCLYLGNVPKAKGIYGATALGSPYFSGSGRLMVTNTPPAVGTLISVR